MSRHLLPLLLLLTATSCDDTSGGGSTDSTDTGTDDIDDQDTGDTDDQDTGDTDDQAPGLTALDDPCQGIGTPYAVTFTSDDEGWVGCGSGAGLWHSTDGGDSFERGHTSGDLYVNAIVPEASGDLLVCGHDYDGAGNGVLLYRFDGSTWTELLRYGANADDPTAVYFANCGAVASPGDGTLIAANDTSGDISWSTDDGATWAKEDRYWEDDNLDPDGYAYHYMLNLLAAGGHYYGAGSQITAAPVFFGPSSHPDADWWNFDAVVIDDDITGEVWSLATPDQGTTWLAGGRDQAASGRASGFIRLSTDGGQGWAPVSVEDPDQELDIVHDIRFSDDGLRGVAVGHRYPVSRGGFVLLTADAGATWTLVETDEPLPLLYAAAVHGDTYWVAGDMYLGRGVFQ